jgi:hypothetical protein
MKATEKQKQQMKEWYSKNKRTKMIANKKWITQRRKDSTFVSNEKLYRKQYLRKNKEQIHRKSKERKEIIVKEVLIHYGGNPPRCVRCGFSDIMALTIDHINGSGCKERKKLGKTGVAFYRWLQKNHYPQDYQVLCMNCQFIKMRTKDVKI